MGFKNWIDEDRPVMTAIDWKARAEAAEAELAALKAANEWRPVRESPDEAGDYLGWEADGTRRLIIVTYNPDLDYDDSWAWGDWYDESVPITHWQPLPTPPQE